MRLLAGVLLLLLSACPGSGNNPDGGDDDDTPDAPVVPGPALIDLVAGSRHTCALLEDRTVRCWGDNREGQLGDGTTTSNVHPVTVTGLAGGSRVGSIAAGHEHTCAVMEDGTARCWGRNANGQLGNGTKIDSETPVTVTGLSGIRSIHPGVSITCATTLVGRVHCWGRGGELGDGTVDEALTPRVITSLTNITGLSVSSNGGRSSNIHVCGIRIDGSAFCWGANDDGQLGNNSQNSSTTPVDVTGVDNAAEIVAGGGHACVRANGTISCWGVGGLTGDGGTNRRLTPVAIGPTAGMPAGIFAGDNYTLLQTTEASLYCWGQSGRGECGDGADFTPGGPNYTSPIATLTSHFNTRLFEAGGAHACAYNDESDVTSCWGTNEFGELGSGDPSSGFRISTPQAVVWN
jgi:alpha-tubulin suppressor-like RCC1 family protein